jgi:DHA3 family macrolide efflux protein-like MFS transporter
VSRTGDMYRVVAARFLSRSGSEAAFFIGVWGKAAFDLGAGPTVLAVIMFTISISSILGSLVAGVLVDRYGPRKVLMFAEVLFIPAALAFATTQTLTQVAVIAGVWAFLGAPVVTAGATFAPYLAGSEDDLKRMNSWIEGSGSLAFAVGPAVGAVLVTLFNVNWVFVMDAATSAVAALLIIPVHLKEPDRVKADEGHARHPVSEAIEGLRTVYSMRNVRYYVLMGSIVWMSFGAFGALEPLFFRDVVGTGIEAVGYMNTMFGVGFILGAASLTRLPHKYVSARTLNLFMIGVGMGTVLYVGSADLRIIAVGAFVWAYVIGLMEPLLRTLIHRDAPHAMVGRVMGISEVHRRAGELLPLGFAPALAGVFGVQRVMIGGGVVAAAVAVLALRESGAIDRERAELIASGAILEREVEIASPLGGDEPLNPTP